MLSLFDAGQSEVSSCTIWLRLNKKWTPPKKIKSKKPFKIHKWNNCLGISVQVELVEMYKYGFLISAAILWILCARERKLKYKKFIE